MKKWVIRKKTADIKLISQSLKINQEVAQILVNRGMTSKEECVNFLNAKVENFHDFTLAKDVMKALEIVKKSIENNEKIVIYGDYDVDGVMSTTILYKALKNLNAKVSYYIPEREKEGYGLNKNAIYAIKADETDLIITCDNGITGLEEVIYAKQLGLKVIIIDHHEPLVIEDELIPVADAVIDPKQKNCTYPFKQMCAAGLSFRFVDTLYTYLGLKLTSYEELFIFAMIATFCDIVDLKEDNRIFSKVGLEYINSSYNQNIGLNQLIKQKNINKKELTSYDVGFIIGPSINATGRLEKATISVDLFTEQNEDKALVIANTLVDLNEKRKELTSKSVERILENLQSSEILNDDIYVIYDDDIHESIAGIVAGRIKDKYYHPTIVLTNSVDTAKGSARSIEAYDIFEGLSQCQKYFVKFGGHKMAAGLSIKHENIEVFRKLINSNSKLKKEDFCEVIAIDNILDLNQVTYDFAKELFILKPYGKDNKEPLYGTKNVLVSSLKIIEEKNTIIFTFKVSDYREIKAICFGMVDEFRQLISANYDDYTCDKIMKNIVRNVDLKLDLVYYVDINEYNNNLSVQLKIKDFRFAQ